VAVVLVGLAAATQHPLLLVAVHHDLHPATHALQERVMALQIPVAAVAAVETAVVVLWSLNTFPYAIKEQSQ
jgi:hypothetical protein